MISAMGERQMLPVHTVITVYMGLLLVISFKGYETESSNIVGTFQVLN